MRITTDEYNAILLRQREAAARRKASSPVVERPACHEPLEAVQAQAPDTGRILVRVTSFRRRLLDEDNLAEKYFVDCCRYAGLLASDAPDKTRIEVRQVKARSKEEEETVIEIEIERL
jgi:hypothetical protein